MTTHKIDPEMVRAVLGINKYIENNPEAEVVITYLRNGINIRGDAGLEDWLYPQEGIVIWNEGGAWIDCHRFKDMAIEYLAGKGYPTDRINHCRGAGIVYATIDGIKLGYTWGSEGADCPTYIEAELEMLNDVWKQIQEEKKDEN